jgi:cell surface protein SprA
MDQCFYPLWADYRWTASAISVQEILGNTVENAVNKQANLNFNFTTLYNKVPFLKDLNTPPSRPGQPPGRPAASREQPSTGKNLLRLRESGKAQGELMDLKLSR